ncbi:MAG: cation:proton antiporter [Archaeoglobaceae archaeon]
MDVYLLLTIFLGISALLALLFERIGLSRIAGYIMTGFLISLIFSGSIEANKELLGFFSQIAITLLVFEIGREIGIERVRKMDLIPLTILGFEVFFALILAMIFGYLLKLDILEILILAIIASFSSTAILYSLLENFNFPQEVKKQILTVTILEDVYALIILAILPSFKLGGLEIVEILRFGALSLVIVAVLIIFGLTIVKRFFVKVVEPNELGVAIILASAFLFAMISKFFGLSPALGAFSAGVALSAHPKNKELGEYLKPMREVFLILFFISLGTEAGLIKELSPIIFLAPLVVFLRFLAFASSNWLVTGRNLEESIRIGFVASCVGEFGIVVTYEAMELGLIGVEFLTLSAFSVILGAIISSSMGGSEKYSRKLSSIVPVEIKILIGRISVNVNRVAEGKASKVVQKAFYRVIRNVLALLAVIILGSSTLYLLDHLVPAFSHFLILFIIFLFLLTILLIGINTKKYSEELCTILVEKSGLNPKFKEVFVGFTFMAFLLISLSLTILFSGRYFTELMLKVYELDISNYIVFSVLLLFTGIILILYWKLKKMPL